MPDAALDMSVRILARELLRVRTRVGTRRTVGITLKGNRRHGDHRKFGKPLFKLIVLRFALGQSEPPTIVMDDYADVIGIVSFPSFFKSKSGKEHDYRTRLNPVDIAAD